MVRPTTRALMSAGHWVKWCLLTVEVGRGLKGLKTKRCLLRARLIHLRHQAGVDFPGSAGGIPVLCAQLKAQKRTHGSETE